MIFSIKNGFSFGFLLTYLYLCTRFSHRVMVNKAKMYNLI